MWTVLTPRPPSMVAGGLVLRLVDRLIASQENYKVITLVVHLPLLVQMWLPQDHSF